MEFIDNAFLIGIETETEGSKLYVTRVAMMGYDGIMYHDVDFEKDNDISNAHIIKYVQSDLDEAKLVVGFCPSHQLSSLKRLGLNIPAHKMIDLVNAGAEDINEQIYQLAKEWNASYPGKSAVNLSIGKQFSLLSDLYRRICSNDKTPAPVPEPDEFGAPIIADDEIPF